MLKRKSFFERLTGGINLDDDELEDVVTDEEEEIEEKPRAQKVAEKSAPKMQPVQKISEQIDEDAQLSIDIYQSPTEVVVQTMVAGVRPEDLTINISRDSITIKGKREENRSVTKDSYVIQELYWGSFTRTVDLPDEVDPEEAEAIEKHGLVIIRIPKINKGKQTSVKVKSI